MVSLRAGYLITLQRFIVLESANLLIRNFIVDRKKIESRSVIKDEKYDVEITSTG